ncbi:von Willebrand factor type A domain protein [Necator americanus]|uniref:von Willebrand factor type A domain protein n=1 Tax=Necator americanus TaxID=51031 RepID=W2SGC8_NECAM|nr:von Willebrand factor type A domain protein [Necator americanus]ETN68603.1 von Willebrand factor type A domain protein [Necator americanus]
MFAFFSSFLLCLVFVIRFKSFCFFVAETETSPTVESTTKPEPLAASSEETGQILKEKEDELLDHLSSECPCTPNNIWLDLFFLLDSSSAMTRSSFQFVTAYVESVLYQMSVGLSDGQETRVGFITYGKNAKLLYNLSFWDSTNKLVNYMNLSLESSLGTDIEGAIRLAEANFIPPHHRLNARKVIVIIASAFQSGTYHDPMVAANTFKEDGGIIITVGEKVPDMY